MNIFKNHSIVLLIIVGLLSACGPEAPELENDEELISTLTLNFRNSTTGEVTVFKLYDEDGNGPLAPVYTNGILEANQSYVVEVGVLNETITPAEDIAVEIEEEGAEHQFFYQISNGLNLEFAYDDTDVNNLPIGLRAVFFTGESSIGTLTTILKHEPDKTAEGVKDGMVENAGGETDIQAIFEVTIE
ncbi:MAG: hypothetical protein ACJAT1_001861 [Marivirga sp.]|jgi:hypothetical protein